MKEIEKGKGSSKSKNNEIIKEFGKIKWYSKSKNYGFISNDEGIDVFFRIENITKSLDEIDKEIENIVPETGDIVKYIQYTHRGQERAKKIIIKQRVKSDFICPHCNETTKPKIVFDQNGKDERVGQEFEGKVPMYTVCPNCFNILEKYETQYEEFSNYNRAAMLLLILLILGVFVRLYLFGR